jgi:glutathione S-transferase
MPHRLITMPFSHFCEKARWSLDAAGVSYSEEGHCPGLHRFAVRRAGGRRSVPVLVREHGDVLTESADIVRFADAEASAERKLLPTDPRARAEVEALEKSFDEGLAPHVRRYVYFHLLPRRAETFRLFDIRTPLAERVAVRAAFPVVRRLMRRLMHIDEARALESRDRTRRAFDEVSALLADGRPFLAGNRFSSADITFAALTAPMILPPEHPVTGSTSGIAIDDLPDGWSSEARYLQATPAGLFAARLYRECRGDAHTSPLTA